MLCAILAATVPVDASWVEIGISPDLVIRLVTCDALPFSFVFPPGD